MAVLRTKEEKREIIHQCVRIEAEGGDVLSYLKSQNYVSPRATWINFQQFELGRKKQFITDGKPIERKSIRMRGKKKDWVAFALAVMAGGEDPYKALSNEGYKSLSSTFAHAIDVIYVTDPDLANKFYEYNRQFRRKGKNQETVTTKEIVEAVNQQDEVQEISDTVDYTAIPAPAEEEKKITVPVSHMVYKVRGVECSLGKFYYDSSLDLIQWEPSDQETITVMMTPQECRQLIDELPTIMGILGVQA